MLRKRPFSRLREVGRSTAGAFSGVRKMGVGGRVARGV